MAHYVYILASRKHGTLYIGSTSDLPRRIYEHKEELVDGFTKRHGIKTLVYFEVHDRFDDALQRERTMKHWKRDWKISLIERDNPDWKDLFPSLFG